MTRWPSLIVSARAVAESIPPDRRTTAVSTIVLGMHAEGKGVASRDFIRQASGSRARIDRRAGPHVDGLPSLDPGLANPSQSPRWRRAFDPAPRPRADGAVISLPPWDAKLQRALHGSEVDRPRGSVEQRDVELVPVSAGAGHREDVPPRKTSVAIRVGEREGAVRERPESPAREGDVRQHRDSVL